jgi:serine/threonine protein kinase
MHSNEIELSNRWGYTGVDHFDPQEKTEVAPTSLEGQILGKYRVLESLGRGGMARVYRAYHPQLDRYVAVKVLRSDLVEDEEFLARFRREARAVAALRHANIVQVYDFDVQDDLYYIVLELLEGDTLKVRLADYHARNKQIPWGEMGRILLDVLDGLAYAHSEGMIHRDIKPANILLTRRGQAVIADFGIAQIIGGTNYTVSGALMGTLNYMAPEQGLENRSDARSDIYSLGIVFYEMLTHRTPFEADTPLAILMKHLNNPLPLPRQIEPSIPEPFERIVLKALAKSPESRYQSAEAMVQALHNAADEARLDLPERISLPFSFTTAATPSEPVAVLSGTAREKIADADFAADDTEATLGEQLEAERVSVSRRKAHPPSAKSYEPVVMQTRTGVAKAILNAVMVFITVNLIGAFIASLTSYDTVFGEGWPWEFFLISWGLCIIMAASGSIWMLIPVGIMLGNGIINGYCALTNDWNSWDFLWPLEPLLFIGTVWLTAWLAGRGDYTRQVSRSLGKKLGWASIILLIIFAVVGLAFTH